MHAPTQCGQLQGWRCWGDTRADQDLSSSIMVSFWLSKQDERRPRMIHHCIWYTSFKFVCFFQFCHHLNGHHGWSSEEFSGSSGRYSSSLPIAFWLLPTECLPWLCCVCPTVSACHNHSVSWLQQASASSDPRATRALAEGLGTWSHRILCWLFYLFYNFFYFCCNDPCKQITRIV